MKRILFCGLLLLVCYSPVYAQQGDINRYTLFTGFDYMVSPARNLTERGFETDFGVTAKSWLGVGGDFSAIGQQVLSGRGTINGSETIFAPLLIAGAPLGAPPPSSVHVPFTSTSYTFAVGPQIYIRRWQQVTFLVRPGLGGIHEVANFTLPPQLGQLLTKLGAKTPGAHQTDTAPFFGLGGGFDINVSRRIGVRFTADWVDTHLFSNLLVNRQNYVRFAIGPTFRWGSLE